MGKIAIVIANPDFSFSNANSAVANYLKLIATALEKDGHFVDLFPSTNLNAEVNSSIKNRKGLKYILKSVFKYFLPNFFFDKKFDLYFKRVSELNTELISSLKNYDLIIEFCVFGSEVTTLSKSKSNTKSILIFDAPLEVQFKEMYGKTGNFNELIIEKEKRSLQNADAVICYSEAVKSYLTNSLSHHSLISVIPCIAWKSAIEFKNHENFNIGFIGSFLSWHKVELLVSAFNSIASKYPKIKLHLIGFGEEWVKIQRQVKQSPFVNRIYMPGFVSEEELNEIKANLDVGVMPGSNWYGSPLKLFEYAESGIPIIAPSTPTVLQYFKHEINALIIDENSELLSLTNHLVTLIESSEKRKLIGSNGYKMMQTDFAQEQVMAKFVNLVNDILEK